MRRRIVTLTVVAAVVAISLFGLPLGFAVSRFYAGNETSELERAADAAAVSVAADFAAARTPRVGPAKDREVSIGVYSPAGVLLAGQGPATADPVVRAAAGTDMSTGEAGDELVLAIPVVNGAELAGFVRAAVPHSELVWRTAATWLAMLGCAVVAVATSWMLARRITARLVKPLEELSSAAERFGDGDFTVRAAPSGVPEIDQVADALNTTAQRVGETLERERTFSADASHQLRTPLTGLRLQLEAGLEPGRDPYLAIHSGIAAADRLERTIDDLLALARQPGAARALLDLDALLTEVDQAWRGLMDGRGRPLHIDFGQAPPARAAAAAVRQILGVLVDNAVTHGQGAVTVTARDAGEVLAIDVVDEGPGLDSDFDPFSAARSAPAGHGIGLRLARSLAEAEGGRLRLSRPEPPTFTLLLPAGRAAAEVKGPADVG
ncbi:HAMP domain-containing sensor histidine kinase [Amycolatopsis sp. H20-H5]|uniref:HAMP domain-containing sensor histidine kinase n=1 Tax=Amycolatopsis sp. H20-H5 TaxID=3046309 RepID=UPI002DB6B8D3|nr:HAMP domain-containing sensor histidine kinase [Amycolatopsis sp. H20-H5]MEC3979187.1 HAMP domain-containing sensor histidine kinase [Amycolatopsis sp. H20-H5]